MFHADWAMGGRQQEKLDGTNCTSLLLWSIASMQSVGPFSVITRIDRNGKGLSFGTFTGRGTTRDLQGCGI
jgi:hypothetical protein